MDGCLLWRQFLFFRVLTCCLRRWKFGIVHWRCTVEMDGWMDWNRGSNWPRMFSSSFKENRLDGGYSDHFFNPLGPPFFLPMKTNVPWNLTFDGQNENQSLLHLHFCFRTRSSSRFNPIQSTCLGCRESRWRQFPIDASISRKNRRNRGVRANSREEYDAHLGYYILICRVRVSAKGAER